MSIILRPVALHLPEHPTLNQMATQALMSPSLTRRSFLSQLALGGSSLVGVSLLPSTTWARAVGPRPLPRATPESQGVSPKGVLGFLNAVEAGKMNLHSFMLVRHGQVVSEGWWAPYAAHLRHTMYSLSKSFTSTAVGLAAAEGRVQLDARIPSLFPDDLPATVSPNLAALRVKDLLMMGAGHSRDALFGPGFSLTDSKLHWVREVLVRPVEHAPGTHFVYNNGASYLLAAIVQKATGQTVLDYLTPRLFKPLGIEGADWEVSPQGINCGAWGLRVRTEDIAKLGQLYLRKGQWNGRRILTEAWVEEATRSQIQNAPAGADPAKNAVNDWAQGYGYQFWRCRHGAFRGDGAYGQYCIVLPHQDAVIAITSETPDMQAVMNAIWTYLLPALSDQPVPNDRAARRTLHDQLDRLMLPLPQGQPTSAISLNPRSLRYRIAENTLGVKEVALAFHRNRCEFKMEDAKGEHLVRCGVGSWVTGETRISPAATHLATTRTFDGTPIAASAAWSNNHTLTMRWQFTETAHYQTATCRFMGEELEVEFKRSAAHLNPGSKDDRPVLKGTRLSNTPA